MSSATGNFGLEFLQRGSRARRRARRWEMEVLYPRCAGLDVHKETVVACVRVAGGRHGQTRGPHVRDDDRRC